MLEATSLTPQATLPSCTWETARLPVLVPWAGAVDASALLWERNGVCPAGHKEPQPGGLTRRHCPPCGFFSQGLGKVGR